MVHLRATTARFLVPSPSLSPVFRSTEVATN